MLSVGIHLVSRESADPREQRHVDRRRGQMPLRDPVCLKFLTQRRKGAKTQRIVRPLLAFLGDFASLRQEVYWLQAGLEFTR